MLLGFGVRAQELYVYTEPASNMPAGSISTKLSSNFIPRQDRTGRAMQRYIPEVMFGMSKNLMTHVGLTFGDMHTSNLRWESIFFYAKYRFLSVDDIHQHFRMAAFADVAYSRSPFHYDEISFQGDKSGIQFGVIATQLWNKLAISATVSHSQVLHNLRKQTPGAGVVYPFSSMNYSLSAGYLVLPREYKDYRQLNLNVYAELLAQQTLDPGRYFLDLAPAIQFIFNSNTKLNVGYRFQLRGDMYRMSRNGIHVSLERTFLNALK